MYKIFKRIRREPLEVQVAGACDPGLARDHNEDSIAVFDDQERGYYAALVCDGMGGHNAGEIASALAVEVIAKHVKEHFQSTQTEQLLVDAFNLASRRIDEYAAQNPEAHGMGCTAVMVLGTGEDFWTAHSGDSRCYRISADGEFSPLTTDHTMVMEMLANGLITPEQAAVHPYRGRISRCLGHGKNRGDPTVTAYTLKIGENLLLCSDGLSDVVKESDLGPLARQREVKSASRRLVDAANNEGGPDNISAIVVRRIS